MLSGRQIRPKEAAASARRSDLVTAQPGAATFGTIRKGRRQPAEHAKQRNPDHSPELRDHSPELRDHSPELRDRSGGEGDRSRGRRGACERSVRLLALETPVIVVVGAGQLARMM